MDKKLSVYRGCFLGMAAGDAMGNTVDELSWEAICAEYGPEGLLGYDLRNDSAEVTSYTQIAAFVTNGLLLYVTRGRPGTQIPFVTVSLREWLKRQHFPRDPAKSMCWVAQVPELRRKLCRDGRLLESLRFEKLGTPEKPINSAASPGAIMAGAAIGLFFDPVRMEPPEIGTLAVRTVALTHGDPEAFLSAAVLGYTLAGIVHDPEEPLQAQFINAIDAVQGQFAAQFPQVKNLAALLKKAVRMANEAGTDPHEDMETLYCSTAGQCLAGAIYACLTSHEDFDTAMITAVNHSGKSAAVAAIAGAVLGAILTDEELPEFYLESLEAAPMLRTLAEDLAQGSPARGLFDDNWDHKYNQGLPL